MKNTADLASTLKTKLASKYLKKIECFCFEEQTFKPGEVTNLPLYFAIDEKMPKRIKTVTLSYSFFEIMNVSKKIK